MTRMVRETSPANTLSIHPKLTPPSSNSPIPQILPHKLRPRRLRPALARHIWRPLRHPVLVLQASPLLDPPGLGTLLRRVAAEFPAGAAGQRERQHVVDRVRERHQDGERGAGCALDFEFWRGQGRREEGLEGQDGFQYGWDAGWGEERALIGGEVVYVSVGCLCICCINLTIGLSISVAAHQIAPVVLERTGMRDDEVRFTAWTLQLYRSNNKEDSQHNIRRKCFLSYVPRIKCQDSTHI